MKNKTEHISREAVNIYCSGCVLYKPANFCSAHLLLKNDEKLCHSFDSFIEDDYSSLGDAGKELLLNDLEALKEVLPILYELRTQPIAEGKQHETKEISQTDFSNSLYASLKRHPE